MSGGWVHVKEVNCSVSGPSTSNVQQTTLGNVSGEQDMCEKVSKTVGSGLDVGNSTQGVLSSSLSHVLCEKQGGQLIVKTTTINSGHTPVFVDHPRVHVAGKIVNSGPTTAHVDQLTSALLAQQVPPLPKFSGESDHKQSVIGTFRSG